MEKETEGEEEYFDVHTHLLDYGDTHEIDKDISESIAKGVRCVCSNATCTD